MYLVGNILLQQNHRLKVESLDIMRPPLLQRMRIQLKLHFCESQDFHLFVALLRRFYLFQSSQQLAGLATLGPKSRHGIMFQKLPKMLQNKGDFLFSCLWRDLAKSLVTQKKFNALIIKNCQSFWCYLYSSVHYSCVYKTVLCNAHLSNTQLCTLYTVQYSVVCNIQMCKT